MAKKKRPEPKVLEQNQHPEPVAAGLSFFERPFLPLLVVAAAALAVFAVSVNNGFVFFDDDKAILYNKTLQNPSLGKFFSGQNLGMYAPFTWMAYWLGSAISGKEAWGYHAISLALHALNAVLVFAFLRRLTGRHWAAFFAALLFALHPVQVEAVSWAAALSTVLFSTFYLLSLLAYLQWRRSPALLWLALSLAAFLAACFSKSAAVTLPLVLVAIDFYLLKKNELGKFLPAGQAGWLSKVPFFATALAFGLYTFSTRAQEGHDIETTSAAFTALDRFFMVCQTILFYPVKLLAPLGFSVSYPFVKMNEAWDWTYYAAPLALLALGFFIWKKGRKQPDLLFGLALYLLPLTVMLPFRTVGSFELRSDRYVYLSCVGLFFVAAVFLEKLKPAPRNGLMVALAVALGLLAVRQTGVWKDGVALFKNCTDKTPESSLCQCNLAYNQLISLDFQGAVLHYTDALRYDPSVVEAYNGRGQAYLFLKKYPEALADFDKAIAASISTPKLFLNRGKCLLQLNRPADALPDLSKSLELEPKEAEAWHHRGIAHEKTGNVEAALADYARAAELRPDYVEAFVYRGVLLLNNRRWDEALPVFDKAIEMQPSLPMLHFYRANVFFQLGKYAEALRDASKSLSLNDKFAPAYQLRANAYQQLGDAGKAQADLQTAQRLQGR